VLVLNRVVGRAAIDIGAVNTDTHGFAFCAFLLL
jgi:hypothetical protein